MVVAVGLAARRAAVVGHGVGRDALGLPVAADDPDIDGGVVVDDPQLGPFGRVLAGIRLDHPEVGEGGYRLPGGVVQAAVDLGAERDADGLDLGRGGAGQEKEGE